MLCYLCQIDCEEFIVLKAPSIHQGTTSETRGENCQGNSTAGSQGGGAYTHCKHRMGGEQGGVSAEQHLGRNA